MVSAPACTTCCVYVVLAVFIAGPDGRPDPRAARKDGGPQGDHLRRAQRRADPRTRPARHRSRDRAAGGDGRAAQHRAARAQRDDVRLHLGVEQQRLGLRRPHRRPAVPQPHPGVLHVLRPARPDRARARPGRRVRRAAQATGHRRHHADRHARCSPSCSPAPSWSSPGSPSSRPWPSGRSRRPCHDRCTPRPHRLGRPAPGVRQARPTAHVPRTRSSSSCGSARCSPPCSRSSTRRSSRSRSPSGSGPPCSSRTSPRPSPRAAARPRPRPCARPARETTARRLRDDGTRGAGAAAPSCGSATSSSSRPARSSPATATSSRGSRRSTSRRSPASPRPSSASPAATGAPSPAARPCCRTGSSSR